MRLASTGSAKVSFTCSVTGFFFPFSTVSAVFGTVRSISATGGDWTCGAPHVETTRLSRTFPESYVREKIVAPRIIHATDAHAKMKAMAMMRFNMVLTLLRPNSSTHDARLDNARAR